MNQSDGKSETENLRYKAEELLKMKSPKEGTKLSEAETLKLIHELKVKQIELEIQITELRHRWAMAEVAANKYTKLYDFSPTGYVSLSKEGKIIELNLYAATMLGKERLYLQGVPFGFIVTEETRGTFNQFLEDVYRSKAQATCEVTLSRNGNSKIFVHLTGIVTENGEQCLVHVNDITQRRLAEEALRETNELFSLFMKQSPIYVYIKEVTSTESRVLIASENFSEMIGIAGSKMIGKTMEELFPADFATKMTADDWDVVSNGQVLNLNEEFNGQSYKTIKYPISLGQKKLLAGYTIKAGTRSLL